MINIYFHVIDQNTRPILKILRNLRNKDIKLWFNKSDNRDAINYIKDKSLIEYKGADNELVCYMWNITETETVPLYNNDGLFHLISRYASDKTDFVCIDSKEYAKNQLILFQDAIHKTEYPKELIKIPCYKDWDSLWRYLANKGLFSFSLKDITKFEKCANIESVQGATVYRERATRHYWYLDNFHKTHYEVFDSLGKKHLGEASLDGILDKGKADKNKHPIL